MKVTKRTRPTKSICNRIVRWCISTFGRSKFNGPYPKVILTTRYPAPKGKNPNKYLGEYNPWTNTIIINRPANKTVKTLIDTVIHEWVHYMQPIKSHLNKVSDDGMTYNEYIADPIEKQAIRLAKRNVNKCFNETFND